MEHTDGRHVFWGCCGLGFDVKSAFVVSWVEDVGGDLFVFLGQRLCKILQSRNGVWFLSVCAPIWVVLEKLAVMGFLMVRVIVCFWHW